MNQPAYPAPDPAFARFLTIGQILDRIFQLMRANLRLFVSIGTVPAATALASFAAIAVPFFMGGPEKFAQRPEVLFYSFFKVMLAASVPIAAVFAIYLAAASYAATQADRGIKVTFHETFGVALRHPGRHLGLAALIFLIAGSPLCLVELGMVGMVVPQISARASNVGFILPILIGPVFLVAMVYSVFAALRLSLAFPACVAEGLPVVAAMKRGFALTRGAMGRIFVAMLVVYAASYAALLALSILLFVIFALALLSETALHVRLVPWGFGLFGLAGLCMLAGMGLYYALTWSGYTTGLAVIYHDQRLRLDRPAITTTAESGIIPVD